MYQLLINYTLKVKKMNKKKKKFAKISLIKFTLFNQIIIGKFLKSLYKNNKNLHKSSNKNIFLNSC